MMLLRLVRLLVLVVMTFVAVSLVVAVARPKTGPLEKIALGSALVGLLVAAGPVRRIGRSGV